MAHDQVTDAAITSSISAEFSAWNATRLRYDAQKGMSLGEPEKIYFYLNWQNTDRFDDTLRINPLLSLLLGSSPTPCECYVFAEMFRDMLKIQGIPALAPVVVYDWDGEEKWRTLLARNWSFSGAGTSGIEGWPYANTETPMYNEYQYTGGMWAQNNNYGLPEFRNHCLIALLDGKFYDPSYGLGPYNTLAEHDWAVFAGYKRISRGWMWVNYVGFVNDPKTSAKVNPQGPSDIIIREYR